MTVRPIARAALAFFVSTGAAAAVPLLPGNTVATTGTTVAATPALAGTVLRDELIPFVIDPTPLVVINNAYGDVQDRVVRSTILDTLIFEQRIRDVENIDIENFAITGYRLDGYAGFATDVDFRSDGSGDVGPTSVQRSADGDTLTFVYFDPIFVSGLTDGLREESYFSSILTDARGFATTGSMTIFGTNLDEPGSVFQTTITGLAVPTLAPVPLPASALLLLGGLAGLGLARRNSRT